jgi:hypothetical protein
MNRSLLSRDFPPKDFNVDDNSIALIHGAFMMPFLNGPETVKGILRLYNVLQPDGQLKKDKKKVKKR